PVPAPGLMHHVPLLEPASPQHAGGAAVGAPLRPGKSVVCYPRQRHRRLTLERQRPQTLEERLAKRGVRLPQGVQEDAVRSRLLEQPDERLPVIDRLTPGAEIPGVVVDEDPEAQPLQIPNHGIQAGNVSVEVELVALVDPDHRIGGPEDDGIEAAEVPAAALDEGFGREAPGTMVVQRLVPQPRETDRVAALSPGKRRLPVQAVRVADPLLRLVPPALE